MHLSAHATPIMCIPSESLESVIQNLLGSDKTIDQLMQTDFLGLTPTDLARIYQAAPSPILQDLSGKDLTIISLSPAANGTAISRRAFIPTMTTANEATAGLWIKPEVTIPFRAYRGNSEYDGCPALRLLYNLTPTVESLRRSKDEVRQINAQLVLGFNLTPLDLTPEGNPVTALDQIQTFWLADLQQAKLWSETDVPTNLGWPWRSEKPLGAPCPDTWKPFFTYDSTEYPFTNRCMNLRFGVVHYFDESPTTPPKGTILMVHGNPVWSFVYRNIAKGLLGAGYRVVAMDYYGFGLSSKPSLETYGYQPHEQSETLEEFVEVLDLKDLTLMVQDWGGPTGLGMGGHLPIRIKNMVVMNTWAFNIYETTPWVDLNYAFEEDIVTQALIPRNTGNNLGSLYDLPDTPQFLAIRNGYWGPFINIDTAGTLSPTVATPTSIFAQNIVLDRDFLEETDRNLQNFLSTKPVYFLYADTLENTNTLAEMLARWKPDQVKGTYLSPSPQHFIQESETQQIIDATLFINEGG